MTISDIIDAKDRVMSRYNSLEYINSQLKLGIDMTAQRIAKLDREIVLSELILELANAESPVNIETGA